MSSDTQQYTMFCYNLYFLSKDYFLETILKLHNVSKHYDGIIALDNISFTLNSGDIFGLLGRNGGGKTTMIKIITSMLTDFTGDIEFLGHNLRDKRNLIFFKQHIAYLPDRDFLYSHMNGLQSIAFFKDFFSDFDDKKALEIFQLLDVVPTQKISTMSKGQAEKLALSLMLAREAKLYLFDEPLAGADVISRDEIFKLIATYCKSGATIIATHLISSVEAILTKALFLNKKAMAYGSKEELLIDFNSLEDSFRYYASDSTIKPLKQLENTESKE